MRPGLVIYVRGERDELLWIANPLSIHKNFSAEDPGVDFLSGNPGVPRKEKINQSFRLHAIITMTV